PNQGSQLESTMQAPQNEKENFRIRLFAGPIGTQRKRAGCYALLMQGHGKEPSSGNATMGSNSSVRELSTTSNTRCAPPDQLCCSRIRIRFFMPRPAQMEPLSSRRIPDAVTYSRRGPSVR